VVVGSSAAGSGTNKPVKRPRGNHRWNPLLQRHLSFCDSTSADVAMDKLWPFCVGGLVRRLPGQTQPAAIKTAVHGAALRSRAPGPPHSPRRAATCPTSGLRLRTFLHSLRIARRSKGAGK